MSFASWTQVDDNSAIGTWESVAPIQGSFSYSVNDTLNATTNFVVGYTAGVSANCGRIRCLNKQTAGGGMTNWGVFANIQGSLALASGAYGVTYIPGENSLALYKGTISQMIAGGLGSAGQVSSGTWTGGAQDLGEIYAIQLNWQRVPASSNIVLIGSMAGPIANPNTYDYSDLAIMASYTDNTSTYLTGVTAGFLGRNPGTLSGVCRKYYDLVDIFTD